MCDLSKYNLDALHSKFMNAIPFNHIVIDNFLNNDYAEKILAELKLFDLLLDNEYNSREKDYAVQSKKIGLSEYHRFGPMVKSFIDLSNTPEFIHFLEKLTGITEIEADPHLYGGGIHRTKTGGRLAIHSDFNIHPIIKKHRRINALLYFNKDWKPNYKGELELWEKDMNSSPVRVPPFFNRLVVFRITDDAFHGHPDPWMAPEHIPRYSLALYYYTEDRPEEEKSPAHMALWQKRYNIDY
jgi:Rps23 Pro-64 3,4-dihydroxylase Tpa1-like proline 4-hydroxylase